ncbi:unnamed protein product [Oncorhynchus mykiss]|uniref:Uncharacterized protein n=1 Tax=Oncorhynchus mykiss TaxID=8022 RepID=A0A060XP16_ONCMY|nr:unnamed protein product [Oncorhynchus mykiss]
MAEKDSEGIIATDPSNNDDRKCLIIRKLLKFNPKEVFTWQLVKTVAMGQGLAALICGTAVTSQYLASDYHVDTPMLQSFMSYTLLCLTYTTALLFRTGTHTYTYWGGRKLFFSLSFPALMHLY